MEVILWPSFLNKVLEENKVLYQSNAISENRFTGEFICESYSERTGKTSNCTTELSLIFQSFVSAIITYKK
jgi:hypothetical protein